MYFLKEQRQRLNLSQSEVAAMAEINQSRLSLAERDLLRLREDEQARIAEILQVPAAELFSLTTERTIYRMVRRFLTIEEKAWLIDAFDPDVYQKRLNDLARAYGVLDAKNPR
jgi:transcriptional regulator with XRE-family HTH domain